MMEQYSLHFYPLKNTLIVKDRSGKSVDTFDAKGGDPNEVAQGTDRYEATNKGTFTLLGRRAITTSAWGNSRIPWGESVRVRKRSAGEVVITSTSGLIASIINMADLEKAYTDKPDLVDKIMNGQEVILPYRFNDFGSIGLKMYQDKNKNGRYDSSVDPLSSHHIHSTPELEWARQNRKEKGSKLPYSHGCIHMYPSDIETMYEKYVRPNVTKITIY